MATQKQRLADAEAALAELEECLGAKFRSLRTAADVHAHLSARANYAGSDDVEAARLASSIAAEIDEERALELMREDEVTPLAQLVALGRDLLRAYGELTGAIAQRSGERGPPLSLLEEHLVHRDLLPYVERLRARSPGLSDWMVANDLFHFERRGGELLALAHDRYEGEKL